MPKDARYRGRSISADLEDELLDFCRKNDDRFPENPSFPELLRSLRKLARKGLENGGALQTGAGLITPVSKSDSLVTVSETAPPSIVPDTESGETAEVENAPNERGGVSTFQPRNFQEMFMEKRELRVLRQLELDERKQTFKETMFDKVMDFKWSELEAKKQFLTQKEEREKRMEIYFTNQNRSIYANPWCNLCSSRDHPIGQCPKSEVDKAVLSGRWNH